MLDNEEEGIHCKADICSHWKNLWSLISLCHRQ